MSESKGHRSLQGRRAKGQRGHMIKRLLPYEVMKTPSLHFANRDTRRSFTKSNRVIDSNGVM